MTTITEISLLALRVYSTPWAIEKNPEKRDTELNRPAVLDGWIEREWHADQGDGFSYGVYQKGKDIVISYAGSNEGIDFASSAAIGAGLGSSQITKAAIAYLQAQKQYGENITFTGHSMGGGLASVMAVWFNRPAVVFNEAPFEATALNPVVMGAVATAMSLTGYSVPALTEFINSYTLTYGAREAQVSNHYLEGEILAALRAALPTVLGSGQDNIVRANTNGLPGPAGSKTLHSQALLTAMLISDEFRQATYIADSVLPLLMENNFYAYDTQSQDENILINFIRSEQGAGDKLTHFAADLRKLGGNIANLNEKAQKAIIAQEIEWYYWQQKDYAGQEFFVNSSTQPGLLQYTTASGDALPNAKNKAATYLNAWLTPLYNASGEFGGNVNFDQWSVVTDTNGATAKAITDSKSQIFIGGLGTDHFTGGDLSDVIFGGEGDDTLDSGGGNDSMMGGGGTDIYKFQGAWGNDTVIDSDGAGGIEVDGMRLQGGKKVGDQVWANKEQGVVFSLLGTGANAMLVIQRNLNPSRIQIKGWQNGQLGLTMDDTPATETVARVYMGDQHGPIVGAPGQEYYDWSATQWLANGSLEGGVAEANFNDVLIGGAGNDRLDGLGGNDALDGREGSDELIGGMGDDLIAGGAGSDMLMGGDGQDYIFTASNLYLQHRRSPHQKWTPPAGQMVIAGSTWGVYSTEENSNTVTGMEETFSKDSAGDVAYGGSGNDQITSGQGHDYLFGEEGNDNIFGMGGDDFLSGGDGSDFLNGDGIKNSDSLQTLEIALHGNDVIDGGAGDDDILGGGGDDFLYGGSGSDIIKGDYVQTIPPVMAQGNDYIDGGDGDDSIIGGGGTDDLMGGAGADSIYGDDVETLVPGQAHADDRIDGGEGSDGLYGQGGNDFLSGGADDDVLSGDHPDLSGAFHGNDVLYGGAGSDDMVGDGKNDTLYGGMGDDLLWGDGSQTPLAGEFHGHDYLDGEEGNDQLIGGGKNDILHGGAGDDTLLGDDELSKISGDFHGADYLDGGDGTDMLVGGGSEDSLHGGAGNDQLEGDALGLDARYHGNDVLDGGLDDDALWGDGGNDTLLGGDGQDQLTGDNESLPVESHGDDMLDGGAGDDRLWGNGGNDTLRGSAGNDHLNGGDGNDLLIGGAGVDALNGGAGDDIYVIDTADLPASSLSQPETIADTEGNNTLQFHGSLSFSIAQGGHLGVILGDPGEERALVIQNAFNGSFDRLIVDGKETTLRMWAQEHVTTGVNVIASGAQSIFGGAGDDLLSGTNGGGSLYGGKGNDTYEIRDNRAQGGVAIRLNLGDGLDDASSLWVASGSRSLRAPTVLQFGQGITAQSIRLEYREGKNAGNFGPHLSYGDQGDAIAITTGGWDAVSNSSLRPFDEIQFADGSAMTWAQLEAQGMTLDIGRMPNESRFIYGSEFKDIISGAGTENVIHARGGDDQVEGGAGNDDIFPGKGSDVVLFGQGDGQDRVLSGDDDRTDGDNDSIQFKAGIVPADTLFVRRSDDLIIKIKGSTDSLTVVGAYAGNLINEVRFADGTQIAFSALSLASAMDEATTGADIIYLAPTGETVDAQGGDDIVYGDAGNDVIRGGAGLDKLHGGAGDDILEDFDGAWFWGGDGNDTIKGRAIDTNAIAVSAGTGNDVVDVIAGRVLLGTGNDTVILRPTSNELTIISDGATQAGDVRTIRFAEGIADSSITARTAGDDLWVEWPTEKYLVITGGANFETPSQQGYLFIFDDSPATTWTYQDILRMAFTPSAGNDSLSGTPQADVIDGLDGNDVIHGHAGDDILRGSAGHDILYGDDGNDILVAGTGADDLYGGNGDDILYASPDATGFFGGPGNDTFKIGRTGSQSVENEPFSGNDVIEFDSSVHPQDVIVRRQFNIMDHAKLTLTSGGVVIITGLFARNSSESTIQVRFASVPATVWTAALLQQMALTGAATNDVLIGFNFQDDVISGGAGNDRLYGHAGNDRLEGGPGNDILDGGPGDDTFVYRRGESQKIIIGGSGTDTLKLENEIFPADVIFLRVSGTPPNYASDIPYFSDEDHLVASIAQGGQIWIASFFGPSDKSIEFMEFSDGTKWSVEDINARTNTVTGSIEAQSGTPDNDTFLVDNVNDTVTEGLNEGNDTINSLVSFHLPANVENLTLKGSLNATAVGNRLSNVITGNSADNILNGYIGFVDGQLQPDTVIGGAGDDLYFMEFFDIYMPAQAWNLSTTPVMTLIEHPDQGDDTLATNHYRVKLPDNIENLQLHKNMLETYPVRMSSEISFIQSFKPYSDEGEDARSWYFGNSQNNVINASDMGYSSSGYFLDGGAGADTLVGAQGDTWYQVDDVNDIVVETETGTLDVITSSTISLNAVKNIEILELRGNQPLNATGDAGNNDLRASKNTAVNVLTGMEGDDTYFIDLSDRVLEAADAGVDRVIIDIVAAGNAAMHHTGKIFHLSDYPHVEDIAANGSANWSAAPSVRIGVRLVGSVENNTVSGSFHDDILEGGAGNDVVEDILMTIYPDENLPEDSDQLYGGDGDDRLISWSGNDGLDGGPGNDVLDGGSGNDRLDGGTGNDVILFGKGDGQDRLSEVLADDSAEKLNVLRFKPGVQVTEVSIARRGTALDIGINDSSDKVDVIDFYSHDGGIHARNPLQRIEFADGTAWDLKKIQVLAGAETKAASSPDTPSITLLTAQHNQIIQDNQVQNLVSAMAAFSPPAAGQTAWPANDASWLTTVMATNQ